MIMPAAGIVAAFLALAGTPARAGEWTLQDMLGKDALGRTVFRAMPVEERFRNPWPDGLEEEFQERARYIIGEQAKLRVNAGNTYFENEKRTYGYLMAQVLGGRTAEALAGLQIEDAQAAEWHRETMGIDYYAAFTLKHQMRKYFYFGSLLDPAYRKRMFDGAKAWTARDPLHRPHYAFKHAQGWGPDAKNSWVDVRTTENLFLMRVTSVYLMAEETGNREVAMAYKELIRRYVVALYRVGMGEWDSENYHGHSMGPLCNLYDFSKDPEVKLLAKAALDWVCAAGALKYFRGGFGGPTKRDYNHVQPFGGSAACMLWVYFGDCPLKNTNWESDEVHLITSAYRPPRAVVGLARKEFERPVEILASKPRYEASTTGDLRSGPEYLETQFIGKTYQMGSLAQGTSHGPGDVNGFKIIVYSSARGSGTIQCVPGPDPLFPGSPQYSEGKVSAPNRVAQNKNIAIWLVEDGNSPWLWVMPEEIEVMTEGCVCFLRADMTWIALHPIALEIAGIDRALTERVASARAGGERAKFPAHRVVSAKGTGGELCGFAVEIGEGSRREEFDEFRSRVLKRSRLDTSRLGERFVEFVASDGRRLGVRYGRTLEEFRVWKDGVLHDWAEHAKVVYRSSRGPGDGPIEQAWLGGTLIVRAGGRTFTCTVDETGRVEFSERADAPQKGAPAARAGAAH